MRPDRPFGNGRPSTCCGGFSLTTSTIWASLASAAPPDAAVRLLYYANQAILWMPKLAISESFTATFRDVPEAITEGDNREEALLRAEDALESALAMYIAGKVPLPAPSTGGRRGNGAAHGARDGESRIVRRDARTRRWPCRARVPASLALAASRPRARPASRFANGTRGGGARRARLAPHRRRGASRIAIVAPANQQGFEMKNERGRKCRV
jgi:predicted RNase H-like HicB family nuclease